MKWDEIIQRSDDILLVENNNNRIISTIDRITNKVKTLVKNEDDLYKALASREKYKTMWIDYDLTSIFKPLCRQTSYHILKDYHWLLGRRGVTLIVIHSWNIFGVLKLYFLLKKTGIKILVKPHWRPF